MSKKRSRPSGGTFKRVLRLIRPSLPLVTLSILFAALSVAAQLYIPILTGRAIDDMAAAGKVNFAGVASYAVSVAYAACASAICQWLLSLCNNRVSYGVSRSLRGRAEHKIHTLPIAYLDAHPSGDTLSRIIGDIELFSDGLLMGFTQFFSGVLTILGTLAFMVSVDVPIALVVVCVTPVSLIAATFVAKKSYLHFKAQNAARGEQTALINERIEGGDVIRAYSGECRNLAEFDLVNERLANESLKATFFSSITNPTTRFVNGIVYAGVGLAGSLAAIAGGITVGELSCFLSYANQYTKPFNEISGVVTEMQNALSCADRVFEFLDAPDQPPEPANAAELTSENVSGVVSFDSVCFSYSPDRKLIRDFNLTVRPGQLVAIVGPTGCGKTTLINLLERFYDVDSGAIAVSGTDVRGITRHSLRRSFGMVLQDTWLKSGTIAENIAYGKPEATRDEIVAAAASAHADSFIMRMPGGYDTVVSEGGSELSQGQRQLLCIARVMLCLPPMLILDEATSSIDTRTELLIQRAFGEMMRGRTSFVVAHRLSTIRDADVILVMDGGQIVEKGRHDELLAKGGFYAKLYNSQFKGIEI